MTRDYLYAPLTGWLILLAQGWRFEAWLSFPHNEYSMLLSREAD